MVNDLCAVVPAASLPAHHSTGSKQEKYPHLLHPKACLYGRDDQLAVYFLCKLLF